MNRLLVLALLLCISSNLLLADAQCNVANCSSCSFGKPNVCQTCSNGFAEYKGACTVPSCNLANCAVCNAYNTGFCLQCKPGFSVGVDGQCTPCNANNCTLCMLGSSTTCSQCTSAFQRGSDMKCYPSIDSSSCWSNIKTCAQCANSTFCSVCLPGFKALANGTCVPSSTFTNYVHTTRQYANLNCQGQPTFISQITVTSSSVKAPYWESRCSTDYIPNAGQWPVNVQCNYAKCTSYENIYEIYNNPQIPMLPGSCSPLKSGVGSGSIATCEPAYTDSNAPGTYSFTNFANVDANDQPTCTGDACCVPVTKDDGYSNIQGVGYTSTITTCDFSSGTSYTCNDGFVIMQQYSNMDCTGTVTANMNGTCLIRKPGYGMSCKKFASSKPSSAINPFQFKDFLMAILLAAILALF